jgi:hypothetical protein
MIEKNLSKELKKERIRLADVALAEIQNSNHARGLSAEEAYEFACKNIAEAILEEK